MPMYVCRWQNGDCSFVQAPHEGGAIETLDEIGNAEGCPLTPVQDFMVHFRLSDTGELEFEEFGEVTKDVLLERSYPVLDKAFLEAPREERSGEPTAEGAQMIRDAVQQERNRIKPKNIQPPQTELGRRIKSQTDAPTRMIDRIVRKVRKESLKGFESEGKPH